MCFIVIYLFSDWDMSPLVVVFPRTDKSILTLGTQGIATTNGGSR